MGFIDVCGADNGGAPPPPPAAAALAGVGGGALERQLVLLLACSLCVQHRLVHICVRCPDPARLADEPIATLQHRQAERDNREVPFSI